MPGDPVIHLIDDDGEVRAAIAFLLTSHGFAVRIHQSAASFLDSVATAQPGCIVSDIRMPEISGLELLHRIKQLSLNLPMILMTGHGDVPLAVDVMKAGAVDFLEKPFADEALIAAIGIAIGRFETDMRRDEEASLLRERAATLSARERDILDHLVAGKPNKVIAYELNISARTVEVHRASVMTKMRARNLPQLIQMALQLPGPIGLK
jgi:two-component system response regulator FixJ